MPVLKQVGILTHPARPQSAPVAEHVAETLQARGVDTWVYTEWDEADVRQQATSADVVIAIGGDGAMLRAARVCAHAGVPVLGINMGHLGFLTEIREPEQWPDYLDKLLDGDYWIEERMMIHASALRSGQIIAAEDALNDAVISRGASSHTVRLETYIDNDWATTYNADAVIIATATGSTAYALAVDGPILPPELRNILIVPVAPHLSMDRPIVLAEGAMVEVVVSPDTQVEAALVVDGTQISNVGPGDVVRVQASKRVSRFVRLRERNYFYRSLLDRLEPRLSVRSAPERTSTSDSNPNRASSV